MQDQLVTTAARPSRAQIEPAALAVLARHSATLLATARRYSATPEDAEDAYQRGVEILLTKAPTTTEEELLPWLKTVVKHEAFAVARAGGRAVPDEEPLAREPDERAWTDDRAERYERLRIAAEAMAGLKPQEIRCLVLKAEGLSYQEICRATSFSYTKVNRCLTEGRRSFLERIAGIESGAECKRLAPLISKLADGEASAEEVRKVRPHLKGCLACKATLREYRVAPSRVAGLVPPVVALAGGGGGTSGFLGRVLHAAHERFAGVSDLAGAKVAAIAASAVVLAGGGAAGIDAVHHDTPVVEPSAYEQAPAGTPATGAPGPVRQPANVSDPAGPHPSTIALHAAQSPATSAPVDPAPAKPTPTGPEFDPGIAASGGSGATADPQPAAASPSPQGTPPSSTQSSPSRAPRAPAPSSSEFAP